MNRNQYALLLMMSMIISLVGGAISSWLLMGEPVFAQKTTQHQKVIRVEKFELVDKNGKVWAEFEVDAIYRGPVLSFLDNKSNVRAEFSLILGSPTITFRDKDSKKRMTIELLDSGAPIIKFKDNNGGRRMVLSARNAGSGLEVYQNTGKRVVAMVASPNGGGGVMLYDKNGTERGSFGLRDNNPKLNLTSRDRSLNASIGIVNDKPRLVLHDGNSERALFAYVEDGNPRLTFIEKGMPRVSFGLLHTGDAVINFKDKYKNNRITLGLANGDPLIAVTDKAEKLIWSAP